MGLGHATPGEPALVSPKTSHLPRPSGKPSARQSPCSGTSGRLPRALRRPYKRPRPRHRPPRLSPLLGPPGPTGPHPTPEHGGRGPTRFLPTGGPARKPSEQREGEQRRGGRRREKPALGPRTEPEERAAGFRFPVWERGQVNKARSRGEDFVVGSITSVFSNRAVVKYSRLEDVLHGCSWTVNNKLDGTYLPLPVDRIIQRTKKMINKTVQYSLIEGNCEHFVNNLRYGVPRSQQVEHALVEGVKAAGMVISVAVDSMRPEPLTA